MTAKLEEFLEKSAIAKIVKLDSKVVLQKTMLSPKDISVIRKNGTYGPVPDEEKTCELVVGGQVLANGTIVKKRGRYYFKVTLLKKEE